jgi:hypothetical protein
LASLERKLRCLSAECGDRHFWNSDQGKSDQSDLLREMEWVPQENNNLFSERRPHGGPPLFLEQLHDGGGGGGGGEGGTRSRLAFHQRLLKKTLFWTWEVVTDGLVTRLLVQYASHREDDALFFSARLVMGVLKRGTVAVFYPDSDNNSTDGDYS